MFADNILGITLYPFIFLKKGHDDEITINHEKIHIKQQIELLVVFFYILYGYYYLINLFKPSVKDSYYAIPFEKEAYENENNLEYLKKRRPFSWTSYK